MRTQGYHETEKGVSSPTPSRKLARRGPRLLLLDFGRHVDDFGRCRLYVTSFGDGGGGGDSGRHDLDFAAITVAGVRLASGTARPAVTTPVA